MVNIEKVDFAVTPEMAAMLREAVSSGEYPTSGEVVREALRELMSSRLRRQRSVEELRRLVQEGIDSGPSEDGEVFFARLKAEIDAKS